jgi:prevent-host-death family protein
MGGWVTRSPYVARVWSAARSWTNVLAKEVAVAESAAQFNIHEAKTQLSRIIARVENGEEIIISRDGEPVAKVVPIVRRVNRTSRGSLKGQLVLGDDWDSPETNEQIARDFGVLG